MNSEWWTGVPAAQTTLSCSDTTHRLVWNAGVLTAPDHSDPEGERALAALGGERLACIEVLDAWQRHVEDPKMLLLSSRGPGDLIRAPGDDPRRMLVRRPPMATRTRGGSAIAVSMMGGPGQTSGPDDDAQLARLLALGGGLSRRLDGTVAAYWRDRLRTADAETDRLQSQLHAALYGRVLATVGGWLGQREPTLNLQLASESASPLLRHDTDGAITAVLPFGWLVEVWARGLDVVWGRFCLGATTADGRLWELLTVGPDLDAPTVLKVELPSSAPKAPVALTTDARRGSPRADDRPGCHR